MFVMCVACSTLACRHAAVLCVATGASGRCLSTAVVATAPKRKEPWATGGSDDPTRCARGGPLRRGVIGGRSARALRAPRRVEIFDYDQVLLLPRKCTVESRSECDTSVVFGKHKFKLPVVPANVRRSCGRLFRPMCWAAPAYFGVSAPARASPPAARAPQMKTVLDAPMAVWLAAVWHAVPAQAVYIALHHVCATGRILLCHASVRRG